MLRFGQLSSFIDVGFYSALASFKIDHAKLDDSAKPAVGTYTAGRYDGPTARVEVRSDAFGEPA